jgi:hypothetical protein
VGRCCRLVRRAGGCRHRGAKSQLLKNGDEPPRASAECIAQAFDISEVMSDVVEGVADHSVDVHLVAADDHRGGPAVVVEGSQHCHQCVHLLAEGCQCPFCVLPASD